MSFFYTLYLTSAFPMNFFMNFWEKNLSDKISKIFGGGEKEGWSGKSGRWSGFS